MPSVSRTQIPREVETIDFVQRWGEIVERRRVQMEAANAESGISSADYWSKRAKTYRQALHDRTDEDPFFLRVREAITPDTTLIDVGAGTGRHSLALAPLVRRVTAVDPSAAMLGLLRQDLADQRLENVDAIESEWMETDVERSDIVICSHVLYPIADVVPFVRKLEARARDRVFVYLRADPLPTDMGLWSEFRGLPLQGQPTHVDLFNVLAQINIFADVEIVEHRFGWTFASMDEAVAQVANSLCLREDDAASRTRLRGLLESRLIAHPNGRLGGVAGSSRSAIMSWRPTPS